MPVIDPDTWYEELLNAHRGLDDEQSRRMNCALVLLLANRIGDAEQLRLCLVEARASVKTSEESSDGRST